MARVLCIACLVLIHVAPYSHLEPDTFGGPTLQFVYLYVIEALARSSVPLLSIISGFLLSSSLRGGRFARAVRRRVASLIVPLVLWNALRLAWISVVDGRDKLPGSALEWLNAVVGLVNFPALTPLHFLRDLFICVLIAPALVLLLRRLGWWAVAGLLVVCVLGWQRPFILNDSILAFFTAGVGLGLGLLKGRLPDRRIIVAAGILIPALTSLAILAVHWDPRPVWDVAALLLSYIQRIAGAGLFWVLAGVATRAVAGDHLEKLEPYTFLVFCSHPFVIAAVWRLYREAGGGLDVWTYPLVLAAMPALSFVAAVLCARIGERIAPRPLALLSGGKIAPAKRSKPGSDLAPVDGGGPQV